MNRRDLARLALFGAAALPLRALASEPGKWERLKAEATSYKAHADLMFLTPDLKMHGEEKIAMVLYPGFTALDLVGPQYFFASLLGAEVRLVSAGETLDPVRSDTGLAITPTHTLATCPADVDVLFVPGAAAGVARALANGPLIDFLRTRGARARHVTSVCTGSLLLGKAGLLKGRRATSHWVTLPLLERCGAIPVAERVVWDGPVVTGAGVTAGVDFALQLQAEYNPAPPFDSGSPARADPRIAANIRGMFAPTLLEIEANL